MAKPLDLVVKSSYQTLINGCTDSVRRGHRGPYYHMSCQYPGHAGAIEKLELTYLGLKHIIFKS